MLQRLLSNPGAQRRTQRPSEACPSIILCEFLPEARTLVCLTLVCLCAGVWTVAVVDYVTSRGSTSQASAALGQVRGLRVGIGMGGEGVQEFGVRFDSWVVRMTTEK